MDEQALKDHHLNLSATHVDFMIGTADLSVTGILSDGTQVPIFENGTWAGEFV
jgi:aminopeptidase